MEATKTRGTGFGAGNAAAEKGKRRHGSTALFVAVDYAFLLAFAGFLSYLVVSHLLPSAASS
uniref:CASP-like protein n=1 Tax=Leersia perrieri TaxID=77586 RepID=A0A0D9XXF0_9ORYZ